MSADCFGPDVAIIFPLTRHVVGNDFACLLDKLNGKAGAVFKATSVGIGTLVRDWREE